MTHPLFLRQKVRAIRLEEQLTIDQIAARLGLSRSTIYHWVRDMPITESGSGGAWPDAARRKGNKVMQSKYRALREAAYREGLRRATTAWRHAGRTSATSSASTSRRETSETETLSPSATRIPR